VSGTQATGAPPYYRPDKLVRVDARNRTMDGFLVRGGSSGAGPTPPLLGSNGGSRSGAGNTPQEDQQEPMVVDLIGDGGGGERGRVGLDQQGYSAGQGSGQQQVPAPHSAALKGSIARKRAAPGGGALGGDMGRDVGSNPLDVNPLDADAYTGAVQPPQQYTPAAVPPSQQLQPQASAGRGPLGVMCELDSVRELAQECERATHLGLLDLVRGAILVGMVSTCTATLLWRLKLAWHT
jgi:hypothetical protein